MDLPPGRTSSRVLVRDSSIAGAERSHGSSRPEGRLTSSQANRKHAGQGWWDGDNHFHMNYAGVYFNTPKRLMEQGRSRRYPRPKQSDLQQGTADSGHYSLHREPDPVSTPQRILFHAQEYHPPFWGHSTFLNIKKHIVIPDYVGYQNTVVDSLYPSNTVPFRVTRDQGGIAGYAHGAGPHFPVDLALENVDFVGSQALQGMEALYRAWNCGYRVVASAGEDAFPNFYRSYIIGSNRVYVRTGKTLDYDKWTEDFRAGRAFVTSGPLVFLKVNGKEPGDEIRLGDGNHKLSVEVEVKSIMPILDVELLWKGKPIKTVKGEAGQRTLRFTMPAEVTESGWFGVQTRAQYGRTPIRRPFPFAATMPVWVIVGGKPVRSREDADFFVQWMDKSLARAMQESAWNNDQEREDTRRLYQEAGRGC